MKKAQKKLTLIILALFLYFGTVASVFFTLLFKWGHMDDTIKSISLYTLGILLAMLVLCIVFVSSMIYHQKRKLAKEIETKKQKEAKPPEEKPEKKEKGKEKKDTKDSKEPTFLDFVIVMSFVLFLIFVGVLLADKVNWAFKEVFYTEKKSVVNIESVVTKEKTPCRKEENWELVWQKPSFVLGNFPEKRSVRSKVKFLRKDKEVMEFIAIADGSFSKGSHYILTSDHKDIGRKWRGEYYDQISNMSGWVGFDEIDGEYIGEHSVDKTCAEWIPTTVRLKK